LSRVISIELMLHAQTHQGCSIKLVALLNAATHGHFDVRNAASYRLRNLIGLHFFAERTSRSIVCCQTLSKRSVR